MSRRLKGGFDHADLWPVAVYQDKFMPCFNEPRYGRRDVHCRPHLRVEVLAQGIAPERNNNASSSANVRNPGVSQILSNLHSFARNVRFVLYALRFPETPHYPETPHCSETPHHPETPHCIMR
jgi:hypothetical protein